MERIFIVEDDVVISREVSGYLRSWGYDAKGAVDFGNIMGEFSAFEPNLVLLDISLPFFNGFHWCSEIRKISSVPIVFISSASDNMNIVMAMNMGGDDFIPKPFDLAVLTAKIQAVLRRSGSTLDTGTIISFGGVNLDISKLTAEFDGTTVELTKNECRILELLMKSSGKCVSREDIMCHLWQDDSFVDDNTLTVNVTRIRKKLELMGLSDFIATKKGIGYMIKA